MASGRSRKRTTSRPPLSVSIRQAMAPLDSTSCAWMMLRRFTDRIATSPSHPRFDATASVLVVRIEDGRMAATLAELIADNRDRCLHDDVGRRCTLRDARRQASASLGSTANPPVMVVDFGPCPRT